MDILTPSIGLMKYCDVYLLVVEPTHLKNMLVKLDHLPRVRGENKTYGI